MLGITFFIYHRNHGIPRSCSAKDNGFKMANQKLWAVMRAQILGEIV